MGPVRGDDSDRPNDDDRGPLGGGEEGREEAEEEGKAFISSTVNGSTRDFKRESVVGGIPRILSLTSFSRLCDEMQNLKNSEL